MQKKFIKNLFPFALIASLTACNHDMTQSLTPQSQILARHAAFTLVAGQQDFKDVASGNGIYVAIGTHGTIYTSSNMRHWYEQSGITTKNINAITFNPKRKVFYAVGDAGMVLSSADGVSWIQYQDLSPSVNLNTIAVLNDGNEVIGGDNGAIFDVILGSTANEDKIVPRKFYNATGGGSTSTVTAVSIGSVYSVVTNVSGLSDAKANNVFTTDEWKYHGKIDGFNIADVSFDNANKFFHAISSNGLFSNLNAKNQTSTWGRPVCIAHKSSGDCLVNTQAYSIAVDQASEHVLAVGGAADESNTFIANTEDHNSWNKIDIPQTYKLNKIKCFGDTKFSQCLAVGDNRTVVIVNVDANDKVHWEKINITAPAVESFIPNDGATRVDLTPMFEIKFNDPVENVNKNTVEIHADSVDGQKVVLSNSFTPSDSNDHYSFSLADGYKLKELTKYFVVVKSAITDKYGMPIREKVFNFTTGDFTAPQMIVNPESGAFGVSITPNIEIRFSKHINNLINSNSLTLRESDENGNIIAISNFTPMEDNAYVFTAKDDLKSLTRYCVVATNAIIDDYDNKLAHTVSCFTTGDYIAPEVKLTTPPNNAIDVNLYTDITLKFSRDVQNVTDKTVIIHADSPTGTVVNIRDLTGTGDNYTMKLTRGTLLQGHKYFVDLSSQITDTTENHNKLVPYIFNFETSKQSIIVDSLAPTAANGSFIINMKVAISEQVKVDLPSYFTAKKGSTTVDCIANTNCQLEVNVSDMNGYVLPMDVTMPIKGLDTGVDAMATITVSDRPTMAVFSSRLDHGVEVCKVETNRLSGCKASKNVVSGEVFGAKISSSGKYIYLMTGKQTATDVGDGVYKCNIDKTTFAVNGCVKQDNTSNFNTRTLLLSPDGNYAYFNNMYGKTINRCKVSANDGSLTNCAHVTSSNFDSKIERMVMSDSGRNIYVNVSTGTQICSVYEADDQTLRSTLSCKSAGTSLPTEKWGVTMGDDNSIMYFMGGRVTIKGAADLDEVMWSCARDKDKYTLSSCKYGSTAIKSLSLKGLTGLATTPNYVLITDYVTGAYLCQFSTDKRTLTTCSSAGVSMPDLEAVDIFK